MCAHDEVCGRPPRSPEPSRPHTRRDATAACPRRLARRCRQQLAGDAPRSRAWLGGVSRACQHQQGTNGSPEGREERTDMRRRAGSVGGSRAFERVRALGVPSLLPPLLPPLLAHELGEGPPWPPAAQTPAPEPRERAQSRRSSRAHALRATGRQRTCLRSSASRRGSRARRAPRNRSRSPSGSGLRTCTPRSADAICKTCARARSTADSMCTPNERRCSNAHAHVSRARSTKSTEAFVDGRDHCARSEGRICSGGEKTGRTPPEVLPLAVFCYYFCSHAPPRSRVV